MEDVLMGFDFPIEQPAIIKVIGVGGGGGNAVTHMYKEGIRDVTFALCNTDNQALIESEVPVKIQLGKNITKGLGAGNNPCIAKQAAEESISDINKLLSDGTQMVFVTAGMGGGTGTGAAPIIAKTAKEMDILTVGIVTIPFLFERMPKILQALKGVEELRNNVDALLVLNNERLLDIHSKMSVRDAFKKADSTLTTAARGIAEVITIPGHINLDFADVKATLKNGGVAVMSNGFGTGENRVSKACEDALNSPLLNNTDIFRAIKILFNFYCSSAKELQMNEMNEVTDFMSRFDKRIEVIWGYSIDDTLNDQVKVTILATGFGKESIPMIDMLSAEMEAKNIEEIQLIDEYYGKGIARSLGRKAIPKPFVFKSVEQMADDEIIEALIKYPAYNRSSALMFEIARKAEDHHTSIIN
ncbi:MAG: cell division protein FtsZ [Candidatus Azobacteroides pseudotrichonymphae]|jgi:cell division protein FtsZ|uniref:Cell division protein FtsZ n=2 Tax=Candidatus Azobacteroides TaxID=511434 RepID=B6YQK7_AZOPC|nr:cell division protein FtsZ [Candidatus Azobacteroides pseudotrichonymphae]BAG83479.1 cell division protein FtsZ [Candidatus Azobacteroides pseudotrichonymphae genomovar. CFP2]GMO32990.1 MAG: cell division protein FtsZ [Candidatus Azobacteroides pseudotrichonymphae]